ncbi:MAG: efflux RND transporter permease subunit [Bacteroidetes bacterium]|nr:MAG: efflux RND transporter permease subunit [Bacteroidota bacterium]
MRRLIHFFIGRPIWSNALTLTIILFGVFSIFTMKRSFFPELDPNRILITVFYPGASPTEMENGVTIKIEQALRSLGDIETINSTSNENFSSITVQAYQDADMEELRSDVENAVNAINSFPPGAEKPVITRLKSGGMGGSTVAFVGISAKKQEAKITDLTNLALQVEQDLLNTKTISQIKKNGFPEKEIVVEIREKDLLRFGISMTEISNAIFSKNNDITAGIIRGGIQEMSIRSNDKNTRPEKIGNIVVRTNSNGELIRVRDLANVKLTFSEASQEAKFNAKPAVSFQIEKTVEQDIAVITKAVKDYQKKFNASNPDYQFDIFFEFNSMLNERIDLLTSNGITGLILVLVFLGLFLNLRLSAWVAFGIPFSFMGLFVIGNAFGITINMISLFGMILVVGILVDDGIVIAENIYTHYERGKSPQKAALDGTMEVLGSVFSSILTTIVAFSVLFFVEGLEMMYEMAFVVISCLAFSLVEAFFILPTHLAHGSALEQNKKSRFNYLQGFGLLLGGALIIYLAIYLFPDSDISFGRALFPILLFILGFVVAITGFTGAPIEKKIRSIADRGIKYIRDVWYRTALEMLIGRRIKWFRLSFFFPMFFTFLTFILLGAGVIGFTFFPNIPPEFFNVEVAYKPGDSKEKTRKFIELAQQVLVEENERIKKENHESLMTYYTSNIGFTQNIGQAGNHAGMLSVFYHAEGKKTPVDTLKNRVNRRLKKTAEVKLANEFYVGGMNRFGKDIEMGLSSKDEVKLHEAKNFFRSELEQLNGVMNIKDNMPPGRMDVEIDLLPQAEIYGLQKGDVINQIRQGFFGQEAQRLIIGTEEVKIWVRYAPEDRNALTDLTGMRIKTMSGLQIPLSEIAEFHFQRAPESLKRRDGVRMIKVDAECEYPDSVALLNRRISEQIVPKINQLFPDIQLKRLGQFERSQKTGNSMMYVTLFVLLLMFMILALHFSSVWQSFLIMLVIPAGLAGAILGHGLIGIPVSILSVFGMIALIGVLINDAIVFLDRYNQLLKEGLEIREAAFQAGTSRFRPIILTSLTTVAGLFPIITETSMQAQFLIPMASSIAFGILFGTVFILFFFPGAILFWNGVRRFFRWLWTGEKVETHDVEPALKLKALKDEKLD